MLTIANKLHAELACFFPFGSLFALIRPGLAAPAPKRVDHTTDACQATSRLAYAVLGLVPSRAVHWRWAGALTHWRGPLCVQRAIEPLPWAELDP